MINFIRRKIQKNRQQKTFNEYGYEIKKFQISDIGQVEYAQWLHPSEGSKIISDSHVKFYQRIANPGAMIIDIGAHSGDTTVPMGLAVGKSGLVLAFEPNQYVFKILEKNSTLNTGCTNIVPLCLAATDKDGVFEFNYSDASFCNGGFLTQIKNKNHGHLYTLKVNGVNLQNLLLSNYSEDLNRLELIKIDAEGYDREILKTIPDILKTYKPNLMVECYRKLNTEERLALYDLIDEYGYDLFYLENFEADGEKIKIERKNMTDRKHFDMLAIPKT